MRYLYTAALVFGVTLYFAPKIRHFLKSRRDQVREFTAEEVDKLEAKFRSLL